MFDEMMREIAGRMAGPDKEQDITKDRLLGTKAFSVAVEGRQRIILDISVMCGLSREAYDRLCEAMMPFPNGALSLSRMAWIKHDVDMLEKLLIMCKNSLAIMEREVQIVTIKI